MEALVEAAIDKIYPDDDNRNKVSITNHAISISSSGNSYKSNKDTTKDDGRFISVAAAVVAIGTVLQTIISRALGGKSLEEMVETHRANIQGLQVGGGGFGLAQSRPVIRGNSVCLLYLIQHKTKMILIVYNMFYLHL